MEKKFKKLKESISYERALGALTGLAIGDALGMPSQTLSQQDIQKHYGNITTFISPISDHPVSHGLKAGPNSNLVMPGTIFEMDFNPSLIASMLD